jgi:hypothetical protein
MTSFSVTLTGSNLGHYTFGVPRACRSVQVWHASKIFGVHWREGACTSINWRAGVCIGVQERALGWFKVELPLHSQAAFI